MATTEKTKILPHLWYATGAEEAAEFYCSIFPDSHIDRVTTLRNETPSGPAGSVKVVEFTLLGQPFQAITAGPHHEFNDAISIVVLCDDQAELDRYWNALLEGGGKPQQCGWIIDRWGLRWQIVPAPMGHGRLAERRRPGPCGPRRRCDAEDGQARLRGARGGLPRVSGGAGRWARGRRWREATRPLEELVRAAVTPYRIGAAHDGNRLPDVHGESPAGCTWVRTLPRTGGPNPPLTPKR